MASFEIPVHKTTIKEIFKEIAQLEESPSKVYLMHHAKWYCGVDGREHAVVPDPEQPDKNWLIDSFDLEYSDTKDDIQLKFRDQSCVPISKGGLSKPVSHFFSQRTLRPLKGTIWVKNV